MFPESLTILSERTHQDKDGFFTSTIVYRSHGPTPLLLATTERSRSFLLAHAHALRSLADQMEAKYREARTQIEEAVR
jgi:hypothetical protein